MRLQASPEIGGVVGAQLLRIESLRRHGDEAPRIAVYARAPLKLRSAQVVLRRMPDSAAETARQLPISKPAPVQPRGRVRVPALDRAVAAQDQLRQRVAFALHQIIVVSGLDISLPGWMTPYLQTLYRNAFGDYRDLLYEITVNPAMGNYLDINGNSRTRPRSRWEAKSGPTPVWTISATALRVRSGTPDASRVTVSVL